VRRVRSTGARSLTFLSIDKVAPLILILMSSSACGDDDDEGPKEPTGPPELTISAVVASGGQRWTPGSATSLRLGCDLSAVVELGDRPTSGELPNWRLAPLGGCGARVKCGFVALTVDPGSASAVRAYSPTTFVPLSLETLDPLSGTHRVYVELRSGDGSVYLNEDDQPVSDQIEIELVAPEACVSDAGSGDASDSGG
jgi:hypothetical protein